MGRIDPMLVGTITSGLIYSIITLDIVLIEVLGSAVFEKNRMPMSRFMTFMVIQNDDPLWVRCLKEWSILPVTYTRSCIG